MEVGFSEWSDDGVVEGDQYEENDEVDEVVNEEEVLRMMDEMEPPFKTCSRLFFSASEKQPKEFSVLSSVEEEELRRNGFLYLDQFCEKQLVAEAFKEASQRVGEGKLQLAHARPHAQGYDINTRNDLTTFIKPKEEIDNALGQILRKLQEVNKDLRTFVHLSPENVSEYQLAYYPKDIGARYTKHRDALPDDGGLPFRRVTAIVYLREDEWTEADGGKLRAYIPKGSAAEASGKEYVDIEPIGGRLILFLSGAVDHEVLPVHSKERFAVTSWMH